MEDFDGLQKRIASWELNLIDNKIGRNICT